MWEGVLACARACARAACRVPQFGAALGGGRRAGGVGVGVPRARGDELAECEAVARLEFARKGRGERRSEEQLKHHGWLEEESKRACRCRTASAGNGRCTVSTLCEHGRFSLDAGRDSPRIKRRAGSVSCLSCPVLSPLLSCPVLSCPALLPCPALPCPVQLSCAACHIGSRPSLDAHRDAHGCGCDDRCAAVVMRFPRDSFRLVSAASSHVWEA